MKIEKLSNLWPCCSEKSKVCGMRGIVRGMWQGQRSHLGLYFGINQQCHKPLSVLDLSLALLKIQLYAYIWEDKDIRECDSLYQSWAHSIQKAIENGLCVTLKTSWQLQRQPSYPSQNAKSGNKCILIPCCKTSSKNSWKKSTSQRSLCNCLIPNSRHEMPK